MPNEVARLPIPDHLEPKRTTRSLAVSVRNYFFSLFNDTNADFRDMLVSIGNDDSLTGNRLFDRHEAVRMIKSEAKDAKDSATLGAKDGEIYRCLVNLMRDNGLSLKLRRAQYKQLTHQQAAE